MRNSVRSRTHRSVLAISIASLLTAHATHAADVNWDPSATGGTLGTGTANWDTSSNFWWNGTADAPWVNANNDTAIFGNATVPTTVTLTTGITAGGLTFNSSNYTVTGNTLTLGGGAPSITVTNAGDTATIASILTGTTGLTYGGAGKLVLTGVNTYTGGTTINGGTLQIGDGATANGAMTGTYTITAPGTMRYLRISDATAPAWANIQGAGVFSLMTNRPNSGTTTDWGQAALPVGFTGTLQIERGRVSTSTQTSLGSAAAVTVLPGAQLGMWNGGTFGQNFKIAGTGYGEAGYESALRLANASITTTVNGTITLTGNATLGATGTGIIANAISESTPSNLTFGTSSQAGTVTLKGANTYTGSTTVNFGTLVLDYANDSSKLSDTGALILNSGTTLQLTGGTHTELVGSVTINGGVNLTRGASGSSVLALGNFTNNGVLNVGAAGLATTTVANNPSGYLDGVIFNSNQFAANDGTGKIVAASGVTFSDVSRLASVPQVIPNSSPFVRIIDGTGAAGNITVNPGTTDIGLLFQTATGGATTVEVTGGTLRLGASGRILSAGTNSALTIQNGVLTAGGADDTMGTISILNGSTNTITVLSQIADNGVGSVGLKASGKVTLGNTSVDSANNYTGGTTVNGGVLTVATSTNAGTKSGLGVGAVTVNNGSLTFLTGSTANAQSYANAINLNNATLVSQDGVVTYNGPIALTGDNTVNVAFSGKNAIFANSVSGSGSLNKTGPGDLFLNGSNSYGGGTTLTAGTIEVGSFDALGATGAIAFAGGTLRYSASNQVDYSSRFSPVATAYNVNTNGQAVTWATNLTPSAAATLTKSGAGTLTLSGGNTYAGATTISSGILRVNTIANGGQASGIGASTNAAGNLVFGGGTLQYTGSTTSTDRAFTVSAASTLEITNAGTTLTIANPATAQGGSQILTKTGAGTLVLGGSADNSSFLLSVASGEVDLAKTAAGIRAVAGISNIAFGALVKLTGTGTDQIYEGSTAANFGVNGIAGTLDLNGHTETTSNFNGSATGVLTNSATGTNVTWTVGATNATSSFAGTIQDGAGTVALVKNGTGIQTLSGTNTYSGGTTVNTGTLLATTIGALPGYNTPGKVTLASGGTVAVGVGGSGQWTPTDITNLLTSNAAGFVSGSGLGMDTTGGNFNYTGNYTGAGLTFTKVGSGVLTFSGANTYTGVTNVNAGVLSIADLTNNLGSGGVNLFGGSLQYTGGTDSTTRAFSTNGGSFGGLVDVTQPGTNLTINAGFSSAAGKYLTKIGVGTLTLAGSADNGGGRVVVNNGIVVLGKTSSASVHSIGGGGDFGLIVNNGGTAQLGGSGSDQIVNNGSVIVNTGGTLDLNGQSEAFDMLAGAGTATNTAASTTSTLTLGQNNSSTTFGGTLRDGAGVLALTKAGSGVLTLSGINSYTGGTTVSAGTLQSTNSAALAGFNTAGAVSVANGATLSVNAGGATEWTAIDISNLVASNGNGFATGANLGINTTSASFDYGTNVLSGNLGLAKLGANTLTLGGANTNTGTTTVRGGTLTVTGSLNGTTGTALTFAGNGGTFNANEAAGVVQGMGALMFAAGNGIVQSTDAGGGTGGLTFASVARSAGATGNIVPINGTQGVGGSNNISVTGATAGIIIDRGVFYNGSAYAVQDAGGFLRAMAYGTDSNTATSGTAATLAGGATVDQQITGAITAQNTASFNTLNISGTNAFTLAASQTVSLGGILKTGNNAATLSGGTAIQALTAGGELVIRTDAASDNLTISSVIQNNASASSLTKTGLGTLTIQGSANTYTGLTTVNLGALTIDKADGVAALAGNVLVTGSGKMTLTASKSNRIADTAAVTIDGLGASLDIQTNLSETVGSVVVNNGGTITLNPSSSNGSPVNFRSANGFTFTNGGTIAVGGAGGGTSSLIFTGGNFTADGTVNITSANAGTSNIDLNGTTRTFTILNSTTTIAPKIIGAAGLVKAGPGTLVLNGSSGTFSGDVTVNAGTLQTNSGGGGTNSSFGLSSNARTITINAGAALVMNTNNVFGGGGTALANIPNLVINGGTVRDTNYNILGNVTLNNGATMTSSSGATGGYTAYEFKSGSTVTVGGGAPSSIAAAGVNLHSAVTFNVSSTGGTGADLNISSVINNASPDNGGGAASLTKTGAGTLALSSTNTYSGGTTINGGTLSLTGGGGSTGTIRGTVNVNAGGTLALNTNDATGYGTSGQVNALNVNGGTVLVNTSGGGGDNSTFSNMAITLTGGTITGPAGASSFDLFNNGCSVTTAASSKQSVISTAAFNLRQNDTQFNIAQGTTASGIDFVVTSAIGDGGEGNHNLIKNGAGTMSLTGISSFTGATTINAGTVLVSGSATGSAFTVNSGATLGGSGGTVGATTVNAGGTLSPGASSIGTLNFGNGLTFNGGTLKLELNTNNVTEDLVAIVGDLLLGTTSPTLGLSDLGGNVTLALQTKFTFITYTGNWDGNLFLFNGNAVADDSNITLGANTYAVNYNDGNAVTLTVVPEPGAAMALLGGATMLLGLRRRRS